MVIQLTPMRRFVLGLVLFIPAVVLLADASASSAVPVPEASAATLVDSTTANTPSTLRKKAHRKINTDINITTPLTQRSQNNNNAKRPPPLRPLTEEELEEEKEARKRRSRERRARMKEAFSDIPPPKSQNLQSVSQEEFKNMQETVKKDSSRKLSWFGGSSGSGGIESVSESYLLDPSAEYDKWAQAYRMLGAYIDCDHDKDGDGNSGSGDNNNYEENDGACSRWMIWASYVNPNYQGNEYYEYFGDEPTGTLDCHSPDTEWQLLGVYREEFYQYLEQISKHLWAIDEYEYVVALAGLAYMTDEDCFGVGYDNNGNYIYAGVAPQPYGSFEMALYTDTYCLEPDDSLGTVDDYGIQSDIDLGSKDATDDDGKSWAYDWWYDTQEYTLTQMNDVYEEFKYCTSCVDYPTYQDGYYIGDYGTDDDDLINQCWKFWSHDSYTCEAQCIEKANAQGTILSVQYGDTVYGRTSSDFYQRDSASASSSGDISESPLARLLANAFLTLSFLLFVATFLAFAVARRSRYRESRSSRSRRLLDDNQDSRSRRSRRSKSQSRRASSGRGHGEGDGIFKTSGSSVRRSSGDRGKSSGASRRSVRSSSNRSRKSSRRGKSYDPPKNDRSERGDRRDRSDRDHERSERSSRSKRDKNQDEDFF